MTSRLTVLYETGVSPEKILSVVEGISQKA